MQNNYTSNPQLPIQNASVFSEDFISDSIKGYFKSNGYRVYEDISLNISGREEKVITASTFFKKEIIEIKGCDFNEYQTLHIAANGKTNLAAHSKSTFSDTFFNSLVHLGNFYRDENVTVSMAVPSVPRYKAIIERLHDYFTINDLYFKIYMVDENGAVEVFNLNESLQPVAKS